MDLVFHPYGLAGLGGFAATWAMAAFVLAHGGARSLNRHLAILLAIEGCAVLTTALAFFVASEREAFALYVLHFAFDAALPPLYLLFLGHALDIPLAKPLRSRAGLVILWALALAGPALVVAADTRFISHDGTPASWLPALYGYVACGFAMGIVGAIIAWRRARTPSARARAKAFLIAFTLFDLAWGGIYAYAAAVATGAMPELVVDEMLLLYALATPVFVGLLSHAILRTQLFDIDVRLRVGIRRGTVALVFLGVFLAGVEIANNYLSQEYGLVAGGAVAAVLLLGLRPIERAAQRVSEAALPKADGSPEYLAYKKLEVYRAAVESAIESGYSIDGRERATLDRLCAKLGVRPEDAALVEREAASALAA